MSEDMELPALYSDDDVALVKQRISAVTGCDTSDEIAHAALSVTPLRLSIAQAQAADWMGKAYLWQAMSETNDASVA